MSTSTFGRWELVRELGRGGAPRALTVFFRHSSLVGEQGDPALGFRVALDGPAP